MTYFNSNRLSVAVNRHFFVFLTLLLFILNFDSAFAASNLEIVCENGKELLLETVEESDGIKIVKVHDGEHVWFRVIAAISTVYLPEMIQAICVKVTGDTKACEVVYAVTSALVALRGRQIYKSISKQGVTHNRKWIAKKGVNRSEAAIETLTYDSARAMKRVFGAYRELGCVKWNNVSETTSNTNLYDGYSSTPNTNTPHQQNNVCFSPHQELNVSGSWTGIATVNGGSTLAYEIELTQHGLDIEGIIHLSTFNQVYYATYRARGKMYESRVFLEGYQYIENKSGGGYNWCMAALKLNYSMENNKEYLKGTWGRNRVSGGCPGGSGRIDVKK